MEAVYFVASSEDGPEAIYFTPEEAFESAPGTGFNAATEEYVDMVDNGILDPVKVTRSALQNATSVASTLLTTSWHSPPNATASIRCSSRAMEQAQALRQQVYLPISCRLQTFKMA
jgi:hypothetical protein